MLIPFLIGLTTQCVSATRSLRLPFTYLPMISGLHFLEIYVRLKHASILCTSLRYKRLLFEEYSFAIRRETIELFVIEICYLSCGFHRQFQMRGLCSKISQIGGVILVRASFLRRMLKTCLAFRSQARKGIRSNVICSWRRCVHCKCC